MTIEIIKQINPFYVLISYLLLKVLELLALPFVHFVMSLFA